MAGESGLHSADLGGDCKCFLHSNLRGNMGGKREKIKLVLKVAVHHTNFQTTQQSLASIALWPGSPHVHVRPYIERV